MPDIDDRLAEPRGLQSEESGEILVGRRLADSSLGWPALADADSLQHRLVQTFAVERRPERRTAVGVVRHTAVAAVGVARTVAAAADRVAGPAIERHVSLILVNQCEARGSCKSRT
jgi:hypothetical protein